MPTNEQRRQAAKRKLERQQERRAEKARKRKRMLTIGSVVAVVVVVAAAIGIYVVASGDDSSTPTAAEPQPASACTYNTTGEPASKPATIPDGNPPRSGTVALTLNTSQGAIPLTLDRAEAPCAVNAVASLAQQRFYDDTPCHRLTTDPSLRVLQCGDPTGQGSGGPGFQYDEEPPQGANPYARGAVAMAKTSAPGTTGSQFFLVYGDSQLPPEYTVVGRIGAPGLAVLDRVAAAGSDNSNGEGDGKPRTAVQIQQAALGAPTP